MLQSRWIQRIALLSLSLNLTGQMAYGQTAIPTSASGNSPGTAVTSAALATASSSHPTATSTHSSSSLVNLDLSSSWATLSPGHLVNATPVSIHVGNAIQSITGSSMLTPAELLAVYQVVSTGSQSILLGNTGNAIGGTLNIGANFANHVSSLVIPHGVTAIDNIANSANLNLSGNLTNFGNLFAFRLVLR